MMFYREVQNSNFDFSSFSEDPTVITYAKTGPLHINDMKCLKPEKWLSGDMIDFLLQEYARLTKCMFEDLFDEFVDSRVMFMSSSWSMALQTGSASAVLEVTRQIDIFSKLYGHCLAFGCSHLVYGCHFAILICNGYVFVVIF